MKKLDILKLCIFRSGNPQWKVGIDAGISESRLSFIVQGRKEPTSEERAALSKVLGVPEDELFILPESHQQIPVTK